MPRKFILPACLVLVAAVAVVVAAPHKPNGRQFNPTATFKVFLKGGVAQTEGDVIVRTKFFHKAEASTDATQMVLSPQAIDCDGNTIDLTLDPLAYHWHRKIYAGVGTSVVNIDGEDVALDTAAAVKVRINRKGPFLRGAIKGTDHDGTAMYLIVRGYATSVN